MIDASVIASKGPNANHSDIDDIRGFQNLTLGE
jgi:hypothetical protein